MNKSSFLIELLIEKPCEKCLVQPCCTTECNDLYKWYVKHRVLIEISGTIIAMLGLISIIYLEVFIRIRIINKDSFNFYKNKVEKIVKINLNQGRRI